MTDIDKDGHNPTVYTSYAEMKAVEQGLPFTDPPTPGEVRAFEEEEYAARS